MKPPMLKWEVGGNSCTVVKALIWIISVNSYFLFVKKLYQTKSMFPILIPNFPILFVSVFETGLSCFGDLFLTVPMSSTVNNVFLLRLSVFFNVVFCSVLMESVIKEQRMLMSVWLWSLFISPVFYRPQVSVFQKTHFKLPSRDWKWLVWKGNI